MSVRARLIGTDDRRLIFRCPGCGCLHAPRVAGPGAWTWNGSLERPTLQPSILLRTGHHALGYQTGSGCWCTFDAERVKVGKEPSGFTCGVCHSFVTDGRIQFLDDCTHALAGQTVDLPEVNP